MSVGVDGIYLSMTNPETGEYLTANVYTVDGVYEADGVTLRRLSIGQLVMAICLQRAAELESRIISKMTTMELTSEQLELMTKIENEILDGDVDLSTKTLTYSGETDPITYYKFLSTVMEIDNVPTTANAKSEDFLKNLEAKMDQKNSFSQQTMIELQSDTNKRDQSYDMVSNILKTINTTIISTANNM